MHRIFIPFLAAVAALSASSAQAALNRVWVSGQGVDEASCGSSTSPCRQIAFALSKNIVAPGGEIYVRDPAGFAPFTIDRSLTIINDGVGAATVEQLNPFQSAVNIKVGATERVILKGLTIDGFGVGGTGIAMNGAGSLLITNCFVTNFSVGIFVAAAADPAIVNYSINDTIVSQNKIGVRILSNVGAFGSLPGKTFGTVSNTRLFNNTVGIEFFSNIRAMLTDVTIENSSDAGLRAIAFTGAATPLVFLRRSTIMNNRIGVDNKAASTVFSYGDNSINANLLQDIADPARLTRIGTQ